MSTRLAPGDVIGGDFEIVRLLGQGGMGAVYEARQQSTGALRALKTMLPEVAEGEEFRKRFAQEAQVVTKVESEHVVQVLSAGIDAARGIPWIAMELLKGEDLGTRLTRTAPLDFASAREIFAQIGHAFTAAHDAGIVHRDLKPENVFVCETRSATRSVTVKVLDFGIAKVLTSTIATSTGSMGSPLWMAPEQTVKGGTISPAADVWALGLMAFYALTGRFYWHAPNGVGGTPMTLMREITLDPIESASERSRSLGGATLPPGFDEWFARCLEREPGARFPNAGAAVPPLLSLLEAAPKRPPRALDFAATQGLPAPAPTPAQASAPAPAVKTGTAFANTEATPAPARPPAPRLVPLALAALAVVGGAVIAGRHLFAKSTSTDSTATSATPSASTSAASTSPASAPPATRMVEFGGDTFTVGSDSALEDERPAVKTSLAGFSIDVSEVSVSSYLACVAAGRCKHPGMAPLCNAADPQKRNHPINCVGYADARSYCEWVEKRLPSEVEWERAARGMTGRPFPWGSAPPGAQLCWHREDSTTKGTCPIGSFPAGNTPEGLEDMAGNVWEWTTSRYCTYGTSNCVDERRVARGGSWTSMSVELVTTTVRNELFETDRGASLGFRCARGL